MFSIKIKSDLLESKNYKNYFKLFFKQNKNIFRKKYLRVRKNLCKILGWIYFLPVVG